MKHRRVLWGTNGQEETVLLAIELHAEENKVDIWAFSESVATEEFSQKLTKEWRKGQELDFPEEKTHIERELSITDSILPEDIKVERGDVIQRAQTEWQFVVLSTKLNSVYRSELEELKSKVEGLENYSSEVWDSLKIFWDKIQGQAKEKNLFREHVNSLRDDANALFTQMKEKRSKLNEELKGASQVHYDSFMNSLKDIEERTEAGARLQGLFNELRDLQRKFKESKLVREHQNKVYQRIDKAFKTVKAKRYGDKEGGGNAGGERSQLQRIENRYQGLLGAIERMERNVKRGEDDLKFQEHRIANSDGQLEAQIRQAKIKMIEERVSSMKAKLADMMKTKAELETKIEREKEREVKRKARQEEQKAKAAAAEAAKAKIQAEIAENSAKHEDDAEKLAQAAEKIAAEKKGKKAAPKAEETPKEESVIDAVSNVVGDSMTDVIDTVKAVAAVMGEKIEDAVEELKEQVLGDEEE